MDAISPRKKRGIMKKGKRKGKNKERKRGVINLNLNLYLYHISRAPFLYLYITYIIYIIYVEILGAFFDTSFFNTVSPVNLLKR